jgi:hypothetical protein
MAGVSAVALAVPFATGGGLADNALRAAAGVDNAGQAARRLDNLEDVSNVAEEATVYYNKKVGAYGIDEPISDRTRRMRQLLLEQMARELGYNPQKVRYVDELYIQRGGVRTRGHGGKVNTSTGIITIDKYAFDSNFIRFNRISGPREILAHEIGHIRLHRANLNWRIEWVVSAEATKLPGLTRNQRYNLLQDSLRREEDLQRRLRF